MNQDDKNETESLRLRLREVEDENQELRAQNILQNRTIIEMRNEIFLLRIQINEMNDSNPLLRERVRNLSEHITTNSTGAGNDSNVSLITTPPLMAPAHSPTLIPPPLSPTRYRISPRQVILLFILLYQ